MTRGTEAASGIRRSGVLAGLRTRERDRAAGLKTNPASLAALEVRVLGAVTRARGI